MATRTSATAHAARYVVATFAGRGIVFAGLVLAAATLSGGDYARFALGYQIGLFASYLIAAPLVVAGFRLRAREGATVLGRRLFLGAAGAFAASYVGSLFLVPSAPPGLAFAVAAYGAAATGASIMTSQASAEGYASVFARWNAYGSLLFPLGVALHHELVFAMGAAAMAMAIAPLATGRRIWRAAPEVAGARLGRLPLSIFLWSLAYNSAFVVILGIAARSLHGKSADDVALALTLVQAALVVPMQFALVAQPRLVEDTRPEVRRTFASTQAALTLALTLLAFVAAAVIVIAGPFEWGVFGVMAASIVPLGLGFTGAYALLLAERDGARFVAAPCVMLGVLALAAAVSFGDSAASLAACWAGASSVGALAQWLNPSWPYLARPLLVGLAASAACLLAGFVHPALAAVTAGLALVAARHFVARGLTQARAVLAVQR
jgi:hypothetical protein